MFSLLLEPLPDASHIIIAKAVISLGYTLLHFYVREEKYLSLIMRN